MFIDPLNSFSRCMQSAHVVEDNGEWQIAYRDKVYLCEGYTCRSCMYFMLQEVNDLYDMFYTRHTLHSRAYKHKTTNMIEKMYVHMYMCLCMYTKSN